MLILFNDIDPTRPQFLVFLIFFTDKSGVCQHLDNIAYIINTTFLYSVFPSFKWGEPAINRAPTTFKLEAEVTSLSERSQGEVGDNREKWGDCWEKSIAINRNIV
jgi:hypothetical protein